MHTVQAAGIPPSNTKVTSTICMMGICTAPTKVMWMNTRWPTVVRIRHLAPRLMRAVRTTASIHTGLDADMKRFRTAITATTWSKDIFIILTRDTATTTVPSQSPDD